MKRPQNRKLMIRDLPASAAYLLHPSLRGVLVSRPKRWNSGSPSHRIAVNLIKRYKKQQKPRRLPFFCDKCRLSSRYFHHIKEHVCDKEEKRKMARKEEIRKYTDYDCSNEIKLALTAEKQWRYNSMSVMEQTLKPDVVRPKEVYYIKDPLPAQHVESEPDQEFFDAQEQEFEDDIPHYPLDEVLEKSTQVKGPKTTMKKSLFQEQYEAGVFCFNCKGSFDSYNQYHLHLRKEFNNGKCSETLPNYYYIERNDRTMMFNKKYTYTQMRHIPVKRDVSHIQCTLCKAINFSSTGDLYAHMIKCASQGATNDDFSESLQ